MHSKIFKQYSTQYASLPYPTKASSFGGNGCGCCACLHNIIELALYSEMTPKELAPWMVAQGFAVAGQGTKWAGIPKTLKAFSLDVTEHQTLDGAFAKLDARKRNGLPCQGVILFRAGKRGGITWTSSGHYVSFNDYKVENNKHYLYIKDSGPRDHDGWYCYETQMKGLIPQFFSSMSTSIATADPDVKVVSVTRLTVDGVGGEKTVKALQRFLWTFEDGVISGQMREFTTIAPAFKSYMISTGGSTCIKALQKWLNLSDPDGIFGPNTCKALQTKLKISPDGIFGKVSMKALQEFLNNELFGPEEPKKEEKKEETTTITFTNAELVAYFANEFAYKQNTSKANVKTGSPKKIYKTALDTVFPNRKNWSAGPKKGASCDVFVATTLRFSGVDKKCPRGIDIAYLTKTKSKYEEVKVTAKTIQDGDIIINKSNGHICIHVGGKIKEAASGGKELNYQGRFYPKTTNTLNERLKNARVFRVK